MVGFPLNFQLPPKGKVLASPPTSPTRDKKLTQYHDSWGIKNMYVSSGIELIFINKSMC